MCARCTQLDEKLQHYRELADRVNDKLTRDAVDSLAKQFASQKLALHTASKE